MNVLMSETSNGPGAVSGSLKTLRHSHHYDAALHRAITETGVEQGREILERAAASTAYRAASTVEGRNGGEIVSELFASTGLGRVAQAELGVEGGKVVVEPSEFVRARLEMFGKADGPACDVARGVISGALGAVHGATFEVVETACVAAGGKRCEFAVKQSADAGDPGEIPVVEWSRVGGMAGHQPDFAVEQVVGQLRESFSLAGPSYGQLWAELYARAAFDFEQAIPTAMGAKFANLASVVLTEAAHLGTFYSVGGLVRSEFWQETVASALPDREAWARTILELVNGFGWGSWKVEMLVPQQRFTVHLHHGYESESHLALSDAPSEAPRCYFAKGFVAALMNVLFAGDVISEPQLNQKVYNTLFRSPSSYRAVETRCAATSDPFCEFVATPLSPGFLRF